MDRELEEKLQKYKEELTAEEIEKLAADTVGLLDTKKKNPDQKI